MKVLFITNVPFIRQHRTDMYIDAIEETFDVELWDLSAAYGNTDKVLGLDSESKKIPSIDVFRDKLTEEVIQHKVVVITNILISNLWKIYPIIKQLDIPIVNINKESSAAWMSNAASAHLFGKIRFFSFMKALCYHIPITRRVLHFYKSKGAKYDYLLSSYNFYPEESRHFVRIHHVKYDESRAAEHLDPIVQGKYILFIDAALADHPMFTNHPRRIDRQKYLGQLDRYFRMLEERYNMKVVISAHPKSMYSDNDFKGRKIIMYKTPGLIQHAQYIVSHYSTSLFDAVLQRKPFKVMYSDELLQTASRGSTAMGLQMATMLKVEKVNLEHPTVSDFTFDDKVYEDFTKRYIVNTNHANSSNKELIVQFLKQFEKDN